MTVDSGLRPPPENLTHDQRMAILREAFDRADKTGKTLVPAVSRSGVGAVLTRINGADVLYLVSLWQRQPDQSPTVASRLLACRVDLVATPTSPLTARGMRESHPA